MEVIRVKNLSKVYGTEENLVNALKGVELSIEKGEFVAIKGTEPLYFWLREIDTSAYSWRH